MRASVLNISIIGSSIAGSAAAKVLGEQPNVKINLIERSSTLMSRGAGITLPLPQIKSLQESAVLPSQFKFNHLTNRQFWVKDDGYPNGRLLWQQTASAASIHWSTLLQGLQTDIPSHVYQSRHAINAIDCQQKDKVILHHDNGSLESDLVICADGQDSLGRKTLFPQIKKQYAGYIAWRGVLPFSMIPLADAFATAAHYYCTDRGHILLYPIPDKHENLLNWVFYEKVPENKLENYLNLSSQAAMPAKTLSLLHDYAKNTLPLPIAKIVLQSPLPFIQVIYDVKPPTYVHNRVVLAGDAAGLIRPHAGSGAAKALDDVLSLESCLTKYSNLDEALANWNQQQLVKANKLHALSTAMGEALVLNPPRWQDMNPEKMQNWWDALMTGKTWGYVTTPPETKPALSCR